MRILLISNMYPSKEYPSFGVFVKNFIENLSNDYNVSFVLALIKGRQTFFFKKILIYIYHYADIIYKGLTSNYNLIYLHYISHSALPVIFVKFLTGKLLVINAHGSDVISDNKVLKIGGYFIKKLVTLSDCIVVPSKYYKEVMLSKYNVDESKFYISPSGGVDTSLFTAYERESNCNELIIGYISNLVPGKGWDIFIDALLILKDKINVRAIMVGDGVDRDKLVNKIKKNNIDHLVDMCGLMPQKDLPGVYNKLDVFIFPTTRLAESLGLVGIESMSCGVPVIGSNIGGPSEYIVDGKNGYKFIPGNAIDLASKMQIFNDLSIEDVNLMRRNCIVTAEKFDNKSVTKRMYDRLDNILWEK